MSPKEPTTGSSSRHRPITVNRGQPATVSPPEEAIKDKADFPLSSMDHQMCKFWVRNIYAFRGGNNNGNAGDVIKAALGRLLVHYYPFAGRLAVVSPGKLCVRFYDRGAIFVEAEADCNVGEIEDVAKVYPTRLADLVYDDGIGADREGLTECPLLIVQVTKLRCGGFILGLCISHSIADGTAEAEMVSSWAEIARGFPISSLPRLDKTTLHPRNPPKIEFPHPEFTNIDDISPHTNHFRNQNMAYKLFSFDAKAIQTIKSNAKKGENRALCPQYSVFECLTATIWIARTKAMNFSGDQVVKLVVLVNIRNKLEPKLPKGYLGNAMGMACCSCEAGELQSKTFAEVVRMVRDSVTMVTGGHVRSAIDHYEVHKKQISFCCSMMISTTWSRVNFRMPDFGWGDAVLKSPVALPVDEAIILLPNDDDHHVDVFVGLPESAMRIFEGLLVCSSCRL